VVNKNITKIDIINNLTKKTGFSKSFSKKLINDLLNIITHNLKLRHFNLKNIGSFKIINKKSRMGRNPKTKEDFVITQRKSISFTATKKLQDK